MLLNITDCHHIYSTLPTWHKKFIYGKSPEEERNMLLWRTQRTHDKVPLLHWELFPGRGKGIAMTWIQVIHFSPSLLNINKDHCSEDGL